MGYASLDRKVRRPPRLSFAVFASGGKLKESSRLPNLLSGLQGRIPGTLLDHAASTTYVPRTCGAAEYCTHLLGFALPANFVKTPPRRAPDGCVDNRHLPLLATLHHISAALGAPQNARWHRLHLATPSMVQHIVPTASF
eukprot:gene6167-6008_t